MLKKNFTKPMLCIVISILFLSAQSNAQDLNIHELMQRKDLTLKQIDEIAVKHFDKVGKGQGSGSKQYERWKYEQKFHLHNNGTFTTPQEEAAAYEFAVRGLKTTSSNERAAPWTELGPQTRNYTSGWNPGVGRLTSVAIHPSNESTIYVSSPGGGIWKSTNAAASWTPLIDNVNSSWMNVYNLCIDPSNVNTIYAGLSSGGVLKSTNAGSTWATTGSGPSTIRKILVHPTNSNIVFAAAGNGVYRSVNGGTNWTVVQTGSFQDIEFKADDANVMFASTSTSSYYRSTDNGASWTLIPLAASGRTLLAVSPNNPNVVYAVQASGSLFGRFYKSIDAGLTFNTLITGDPLAGTNFFGYSPAGTDTKGQATYDMAICANPLNANEVHIAGIICWKSTNGGTSFAAETVWSYPNSVGYNHADVHGLEWVNNTIYSVSDGGVYKSTNNGDDWTDLSQGLGIRQFYRIACAKTDGNAITGGAQDNGTTFRQANGTWREWLGADGMDNIISPTNPSISIGTSQYGSIYKTTNGGSSYTGLTHPIAANWVTPLFMHPTNHDTIYGGWDGIYRSVNGGTSWTKLTTAITTGNMDCIAVASSNTRYMYGTAGSTLYRSLDAGATWTSVAVGATVSSICVSPLNPQKIWITTTSSSNNVRVSIDMGTTFTVISAGLPALAARSVVVDNDATEGLYVGMNIGVYYKDNVNTAWVVLATGLPLVAVNEVELQLSTRKVRVATYGRGVWETGMETSPLTVNAGADVSVTCAAPSATLTATNGSSYLWSTGATTASIIVSPSITTIYTVTATIAAGGTASDAVQVTVNKTAPNVSVSNNNGLALNCTIPSTSLTATGGVTYLWSTGAITATISVTTAGTFGVTATGSNGCIANSSATTTSDKTAPTASISNNNGLALNCTMPSTSLTATGGSTYLWSTGAITAAISVTTAGSFVVTVTGSNGCTASSSATTTSDKTAPIANAGTDVALTSGSSATLTATGGVSYLWSNGANSAATSVSPTVTTTYTVTVTGSNGCTASDAVIVTVTGVATCGLSFSSPSIIGNKFRVNLRATGFTPFSIGTNNLRLNYSATALANPVIISDNFLAPNFGTTTTTGSQPTFGLLSLNTVYSGTTNANILPIPSTGINLVTLEFDITNSALTTNLSWRIIGSAPRVAIVDDDKVTAIIASGTNLDISLQAVNAGPDVTVNCTNPTATLIASGGGAASYLWSTGETTASITVNPATNTTYSVTATNGSTDNVLVVADKNPPSANAGTDTSVDCNNPITTLTATGGVSYFWTTGETIASINVAPTVTSTYSVTVTGNNGCTASDDVLVTVKLCAPTINAKVFLNNVDLNTLLMDNYISTLADFPLNDPYSSAPLNADFVHVNNSVIASITPITLAISGNNAVVDWVFLELRTGTSGATSVVHTKAAILQKDGDIVSVDGTSPVIFPNVPAGNYYVAVRHRNSLGFRTLNTFALSGTPSILNFTNNSIPLYGAHPMVSLSATLAVMTSGDAVTDGSIDAFDTIIWEIQNGLFDSYINVADYNLDGSVDAFDTILWEINNGKFQELD